MERVRSMSRSDLAIGFLSISAEKTVDQFISNVEKARPNLSCAFEKLSSSDLLADNRHESFDAVVLMHSIKQGRNSITDVADARYSKLLPQLKRNLGPNRVAVIVHSMPSFNPATRDALMMVFRKSQPTTFDCSACVIQCGNPSEMPEEEFMRLIEFLDNIKSHPLPVLEVSSEPVKKYEKVAHPSLSCRGIRDEVSEEMAKDQDRRDSRVARDQPMEDPDPDVSSKGDIQSSSHLHASETAQASHYEDSLSEGASKIASSLLRNDDKIHTSGSPTSSQNESTLLVAFIDLARPSLGKPLAISQYISGRSVVFSQDLNIFHKNWHFFEVFLVHGGKWDRIDEHTVYSTVQTIIKELKGTGHGMMSQNVCVLVSDESNTLSCHIGGLEKRYGVRVFTYGQAKPSSDIVIYDSNGSTFEEWIQNCGERFKRSSKISQSFWNQARKFCREAKAYLHQIPALF